MRNGTIVSPRTVMSLSSLSSLISMPHSLSDCKILLGVWVRRPRIADGIPERIATTLPPPPTIGGIEADDAPESSLASTRRVTAIGVSSLLPEEMYWMSSWLLHARVMDLSMVCCSIAPKLKIVELSVMSAGPTSLRSAPRECASAALVFNGTVSFECNNSRAILVKSFSSNAWCHCLGGSNVASCGNR